MKNSFHTAIALSFGCVEFAGSLLSESGTMKPPQDSLLTSMFFKESLQTVSPFEDTVDLIFSPEIQPESTFQTTAAMSHPRTTSDKVNTNLLDVRITSASTETSIYPTQKVLLDPSTHDSFQNLKPFPSKRSVSEPVQKKSLRTSQTTTKNSEIESSFEDQTMFPSLNPASTMHRTLPVKTYRNQNLTTENESTIDSSTFQTTSVRSTRQTKKENPSEHPTVKPSSHPPTQKPTPYPTMKPSMKPTLKPTDKPTTQEPTFKPTRRPSEHPTRNPTNQPSLKPISVKRTFNPSKKPISKTPTILPTSKNPTTFPSKKPTIVPTRNPTPKPTQKPSRNPTKRPSSDYVPNVSTLKNHVLCGYQGWFSYPGDGAPINKWRHWFSNDTATVENLIVDMYPDMNEYDAADLKESDILMKDGSRAKFFSAARPNIVKKHFEWMREYGISGVFHIRFMESLHVPQNREWKTMVLRNVKNAAQSTGRIFAVSYNIAGSSLDDSVLDRLKEDWMNLVDYENITASGRYIRHNGLPVLRIYGIGFAVVNVSDTKKMAALIKWFQIDADPKYRVFLIGGVPSGWRDLSSDSRTDTDWINIYRSLDGIHPWHVGRWSSIATFGSYYSSRIVKDAALCSDLGILYMPTMWPGFSWHNLKDDPPVNEIPRLGGRFMWSQAYNYIKSNTIQTIWMAQFDEVDEGTAIFKVAATRTDVPAQGSWLTLDADGEKLPNDWYLRLCGEAQKMILGKIALTDTIPISKMDVLTTNLG